jgi:hypothetical protein
MEEEYQYWEEDEQYQGEQYYEEPQGYSEDWVDADSDGWGITPGICCCRFCKCVTLPHFDKKSEAKSASLLRFDGRRLRAIALLKTDSKIRFQHAFNFS